MERLTIKYEGLFVPKKTCTIDRFGEADDCDSCDSVCESDCENCAVQECFTRLGEYEDTGLTPEQIIELKYRNNEEEISETQSYGVYFYECPICNEPVHEKDNFCCKCGQRLKRRD